MLSKFNIDIFKDTGFAKHYSNIINDRVFEQSPTYSYPENKLDLEQKNAYSFLIRDADLEIFKPLSLFISKLWVDRSSVIYAHRYSFEYPIVQKYIKNEGYFKIHIDENPERKRLLSFILFLNDVDEGGETFFPVQDIKIKPVKDTLILFPPYYTHPHEGLIPLSNDKIILNGFLTII